MRELADYLLLQSHSAVGLVDRAEAAGMVRREQDEQDARVVRVGVLSSSGLG
ncbi:MAG TPA: MarR family transcriptional regulator [Trebonia sp.]|nr:MarR family transcriptional regulator [Trebonia sp.]